MQFGHSSSLKYPEIASIYDQFNALQSLSPYLGGWFLLHAHLDAVGVALSMAANVAGAVSLCIEPEAFLAKQAVRAGICDFVVKDFDEAQRILKNEIRRVRPVTVALIGEPEHVILEAIERGLEPDVISMQSEGVDVPGVETLIARGARPLRGINPHYGMIPVHWNVAREPQRWLPLADTRAMDALDLRAPSTAARKRWIEGSPRSLGRTFAAQRFLRMTSAEADAFFAAVQRDVEGGDIQVAVSVIRDGQEELVLS